MLHLAPVNAAFGADILLVDDDNAPDVRSVYNTVKQALGVSYDSWNTNNTDDEPETATLSRYHILIWLIGNSDGRVAGQGPMREVAPASYLDNNGCLFISSEDHCWSLGLADLMSDYPEVVLVTNDVVQTLVQGYGSGFFDGLGPYTLSCPVINCSVTLKPDGTAAPARTGNNGDTAVYRIAGTGKYRPTFREYPLEAVPAGSGLSQGSDRLIVLQGTNDKGHTQCQKTANSRHRIPEIHLLE
jgi:hypothetical protein